MRGFTLIEALVVVAIAGILAALAMPSVSQTVRRERSRGEVVKIADAVIDARTRARIRLCKTLVTMDAANTQVIVGPDPADTDATCAGMETTKTAISGNLVSIAPFTINGTAQTQLVFGADGGVEDAGKPSRKRALSVVTVLTGGTRTIEVWPATGAVRLR